MFDVGFSEMLVIGIVALVVIGPERLPKVARTLGHLMGRAQRYVNDVKRDIDREMQIDELKKLQSEMQDAARSIESSVTTQVADVQAEVNKAEASINQLAHDADLTRLDDPHAVGADSDAGLTTRVTVAQDEASGSGRDAVSPLESQSEPEPDTRHLPDAGAGEPDYAEGAMMNTTKPSGLKSAT